LVRRPLDPGRGARQQGNRRCRLDRTGSQRLALDHPGARGSHRQRKTHREHKPVRRSAAIVIAASVLAALIGQGGAAESPASKAAPLASAPAPPARPPSTQAPAPPPPPERPPPYEPQLLRLAELLGSLAYLRDLCGLGDSAEFRAKMAALLDAESLEQRRNLLAGAYNKGFRDY